MRAQACCANLRGGGLASADGPDGFIGDGDAGAQVDAREATADLAIEHIRHLACLALGQRLADGHDGVEGGSEDGSGLAIHPLVGVGEESTALAVADDDIAAVGLERGHTDLAGEGAGLFPVDILSADGNLASANGLAHGGEVREGGADGDIAGRARGCFGDAPRESGGLLLRGVHLPVAGNEGSAHRDLLRLRTSAGVRRGPWRGAWPPQREDAEASREAFALGEVLHAAASGEGRVEDEGHGMPGVGGHERGRGVVTGDHEYVCTKVGEAAHVRIELFEGAHLGEEFAVLASGVGLLVVDEEVVELVPTLAGDG